MNKEYLRKLGDLIIEDYLKIKAGELVVIASETHALPLVRVLVENLTKKEAYLEVRLFDDEVEKLKLLHANPDLLKTSNKIEEIIAKIASARIGITREMRYLPEIAKEKIKAMEQGNKKVYEIMQKRMDTGEYRNIVTLYPTKELAEKSDLTYEEFIEHMIKACFLDKDSPGDYLRDMLEKEKQYLALLEKSEELRIVGEETDITFSIKGRKFIADFDSKPLNLPSGEIYTCPVEESINGKILFDLPGIFMGHKLDKIYLEVKNGKVVYFDATMNKDFVESLLSVDDGARYFGEFSFGMNYNITKAINNLNIDEKIGGTIHLALGMSASGAGGKNFSSIHWDIIKDMRKTGEIYADGKLIYSQGMFVL